MNNYLEVFNMLVTSLSNRRSINNFETIISVYNFKSDKSNQRIVYREPRTVLTENGILLFNL